MLTTQFVTELVQNLPEKSIMRYHHCHFWTTKRHIRPAAMG